MTIKEAVLKVLSYTKKPMTIKEIYDEIIKQGLYTFGAKNPINVLRNVIERACDNTGYSEKYSVATPCFHSEKNSGGKKVYLLLGRESSESEEQPTAPAIIPMHEPDAKTISLPNGRKVSIDDVIDLEEAQSEMESILCTHFAQFHGYSNKRLLFEAVEIALPMFINDNDLKDEDSILAVAGYLFGDRYVFSDLHIWQSEPGYPKSVSGLLVGFGRTQGGMFTAEAAANYLKKVKIPRYLTNILRINNGKEAFVLYAEGKIVLTEYLNLSEDRKTVIFTVLHKLFEEHDVKEVGYVIPRDISDEWFERLPSFEQGIEWTPLLLQEIISRHPNCGVKVVLSGLAGQSIYTLAPAFASESSMLHAFADVVHLFLLRKQDFALPKKMPAEDLRLILLQAGMLTGKELIYSLHKVLGSDHRFAFSDGGQTVFIRER